LSIESIGGELGEEPVELGVGHDGRVVGVVRAVGVVEEGAELGDAGVLGRSHA
jgi:hypothetical protein